MRDNDVRVNDKPKFMALTTTDNHHSIVINVSDQDQQQVKYLCLSRVLYPIFLWANLQGKSMRDQIPT